MIKCTQCTFQMAKEKMQKICKIIQNFLTLIIRDTHTHCTHVQIPTEKHENKRLLMHIVYIAYKHASDTESAEWHRECGAVVYQRRFPC